MSTVESTYTIILPRLAGTREKAELLTDHLPEDLSDSIVTIDASKSEALAQCFVDELVKQIAQVRRAKQTVIATDSQNLRKRALDSARLRCFEDRLLIVPTKDFLYVES
jgi:hypothetical protein